MSGDPGFCRPVLFSGDLVCALAESSLEKTLESFNPNSLSFEKVVYLKDRKVLGIPLDLATTGNNLFAAFESGHIAVFGTDLKVALLPKLKLCSTNFTLHNFAFAGRADGRFHAVNVRTTRWRDCCR